MLMPVYPLQTEIDIFSSLYSIKYPVACANSGKQIQHVLDSDFRDCQDILGPDAFPIGQQHLTLTAYTLVCAY